MKTESLISYQEYIIDTETLEYKAIWNCQVAWTEECIYYDAETGTVVLEDEEPTFVREHEHRVTKSEYLHHLDEAKSLQTVSHEELLSLVSEHA